MKPSAKQRLLLLIAIVLFQFWGHAQTIKDVFSSSETPLVYLGIDFTKAKLIGDAAANEMDIKDRQYAGINDVVVNEPARYDLKGAFKKSNVDSDLGPVLKKNSKINADDIKSTNTADARRFKESDISDIVKGLELGDKKGVGVILVAEAMSKPDKAAFYWVTFIDMKSKKVLFTERVEGKTGMAFGFRNYWAATVKSLFEKIEKSKYKEWKSKFS